MDRPSRSQIVRRRLAALAGLLGAAALIAGLLTRGGGTSAPAPPPSGEPAAVDRERPPSVTGSGDHDRRPYPPIEWRESVAVGEPEAGRLVRGVRLPREGRHFFTWDPIERASPNRGWRRYGTDRLIRTLLAVLREHREANPRAPRLAIGDLSRPRGGDFGPQYGSIGHASHQNGLDADVYYPLRSGAERSPRSVAEVDIGLSQDLVDRFVAAGADKVFVGPATGLTGPPDVVQAIPYHDNHIHVRIPPDR